MTCWVVETYPVGESAVPTYQALMEDIHRTLRAERDQVPELLSYRTFTADPTGAVRKFVEVFEFADEEDRQRFFARLAQPGRLRALADRCHEIVPEVALETWSGFLPEEWLVRSTGDSEGNRQLP